MRDIPNVPDFQTPQEVSDWLKKWFAGKYSTDQLDREIAERKPLNEKHAAVLVPVATIDAAHTQKNLAGASAAAIWTALSLEKTASTANSSYTTAVEITGRGILTKFAVAEVTSGGISTRVFGAKLTIDGTVIYQDDSSALVRESAIRVIVGNLIDVSGTNIGFTDSPGFPFNAQCKLEIKSDGTRTLSAAWKVLRKL